MADQLRRDWQERIKAVGREFASARKAVDDLLAAMGRGTVKLPARVKVRDVRSMSENLEGTYVVRLFAAFEAGLRSYWTTQRKTEPPAKNLIDAVAARRFVADETRNAVHSVRDYRNSLVHESDAAADPVELDLASGNLQEFFARLPFRW